MNVSLIGRVGKDPELKTSKSGNQYCMLRVCEDVRNRDGSVRPMWVTVMDMQSRSIHRVIRKGALIHVCGELVQGNTYMTKDNRATVELTVFANSVSFVPLGKKQETDVDASTVEVHQTHTPKQEIFEHDPEMPF